MGGERHHRDARLARRKVTVRRVFAVVLVMLTATLSSPVSILGQDSTSFSGVVTPNPAACRVVPRTIGSLIAVYATPVAQAPVIDTLITGTPTGEPADEATAADVTAVVREVVACVNADDFLRMLALYTDNGARTLLAGQAPTAEVLREIYGGTPARLPVEARESVGVRNVRGLADGRVSALADLHDHTGDYTILLTLVRQGDLYLINSQVDVSGSSTTPTPEPPGA